MLTIEEITQKLTPVFEANGVTKAILFGSYANGTATDDSDVDIVIETEPHVRGWDFCGIIEEMRQCLDDKPVDLIPSRAIVPNGGAYMAIKEMGKVIYEK